MKKILIIAQEINQPYIKMLMMASGRDVEADVISGTYLNVERINLIKSPSHDPRSLRSRLVCWIKHYLFVRSWMKKNRGNKYDLIFAVSNPPINSYIGLRLKKYFNVPFVYMNWDVYPQIVERTIKSPVVKFLCWVWREWNSRNFPKIDSMITIGDRISESIKEEVKGRLSISVISLGVDTNALKPVKKRENRFILENGIDNKFIVLFSGKMGIGHNLEMILEAANLLKDNREIVFVFIGSGPKYKDIETYLNDVDKGDDENVRLFPWQDEEMYPYSIACGDVAIVTEEKSLEGLMLPSRLFSMMACGEAIIGICGRKDDLYNIVMENKIGTCLIEHDANELASTIEYLFYNRSQLEDMKHRARSLAKDRYDIKNAIGSYRKLFETLWR